MASIKENKPGAFFICTETSPRCYIIQEVNVDNVDRMLADLQTHSSERDTPPIPALPWWFTPECESQLMSASEPMQPTLSTQIFVPQVSQSNGSPISPSAPPPPQNPDQIRQQLKSQLEYYFSRENLMTDRYLRCQMDNDQYVPIRIVAGFPKVKRLTNDYDLIVQVLRESAHVQVDQAGERVRPVSKRCTIILREIPESTDEKEVASMFAGGPPFVSIRYGLNNSWYVTFESEEATQRAFLHLQHHGKTFNDKPICARIKTGGAPCSETVLPPERAPSALSLDATTDFAISVPVTNAISNEGFDLGNVLSSYGYVPRATYKPGATVVHVTSTVNLVVNKSNPYRPRGNSSNYYRGGGRRGGNYMLNGQRDHRDYGNYQGEYSRRSNSYLEIHREGGDSQRGRGRHIKPNVFNSGPVRSRTPIEAANQSNPRNDFRQRSVSDYNQKYIQSKLIEQTYDNQNTRNSPKRDIRRGLHKSGNPSSTTTDADRTVEASNSAVDGTENKPECPLSEKVVYNFEEGAFPSLSEEKSDESLIVKKVEKLTFSAVAAGKKREKKEQKERKSYAQTLMQKPDDTSSPGQKHNSL